MHESSQGFQRGNSQYKTCLSIFLIERRAVTAKSRSETTYKLAAAGPHHKWEFRDDVKRWHSSSNEKADNYTVYGHWCTQCDLEIFRNTVCLLSEETKDKWNSNDGKTTFVFWLFRKTEDETLSALILS